MAVDARIRKTKEKLTNALIELLKDNRFEDISPAMLCKKAGINRSTFYRNYRNIMDLKDEIEDRVLAEINWHDREFDAVVAMEAIMEQFHYLESHRQLFCALSAHGFEDSIFSKVCRKLIADALKQYPQHQHRIAYEEYEMECIFRISAMAAIFYNWYQKGMQGQPEAIARYLVRQLSLEYSDAIPATPVA